MEEEEGGGGLRGGGVVGGGEGLGSGIFLVGEGVVEGAAF